MSPRVRIDSYFSIDTDLAGTLKSLPEFVSGNGYNIQLASADGSEHIETRFFPGTEDELPCLQIDASEESEFFHRVFGIVTYALAAHSDNLRISRRDKT